MFKTIKSKTIFMQGVMLLLVIGIISVFSMLFFDDYYFSKKLNDIEKVYQYLEQTDIGNLHYNDSKLMRYREKNLKFLITDENFVSVFEKNKSANRPRNKTYSQDKDPGDFIDWDGVDARINRYIKGKVNKYKTKITLKNTKHRIAGYGIIVQNNKKYYVYIYETKSKMQIGFTYNKIFLLITGILAIIMGIIVSIIIANKISKPLKEIERATRQSIDNDFELDINEKYNFKEVSDLSKSINMMLAQIRGQIHTLEEEIEQKKATEESRRHFINNVSHQMKTPLAIISSQVEMLALIDDEQKRQEYCSSIVEETFDLSELINNMIVIYSSQNDEAVITLEKTNVGELVEAVCEKYKDVFEVNHILLHQSYEDDCQARLNRRYISQAVDNYITNSIKHSSENDSIYVRVMKNADYIRIEVENQGPAIPSEYQEKVWEMFFKGDVTETLNGQKGSGLGLYLVKSIVELHQGNCGFKNLEKGIVFWIEIPKE